MFYLNVKYIFSKIEAKSFWLRIQQFLENLEVNFYTTLLYSLCAVLKHQISVNNSTPFAIKKKPLYSAIIRGQILSRIGGYN